MTGSDLGTGSPAISEVISDPISPALQASRRALAGVNFFLADVRDGLGPFLGIFLLGQGWAADEIGYAMTAGGMAGMLAAVPMGAVADATPMKRGLVALCAGVVIAASLALLGWSSGPVVVGSQILSGLAAAAIGPALVALTLGLVGQDGLPAQLGRNEAFNHAGNMTAALLAGWLGYQFGIAAVFWLMIAMAGGSIVALLFINPRLVDNDVARGLDPGASRAGAEPPRLRLLLRSAPLMAVGGTLLMFHLGNAAMLPLLGQSMAASGAADPAAYTAATVVVAQLTMVPMALIAAWLARTRGYEIVFLIALAALPVRGLVAGLWPSPLALLPVQMLDGVGAGLLGVATPGIVARILRGSGHVNAGLGAVMTLQGVGSALSPSLAGFIAVQLGYGAAFCALAGVAGAGLLFWLAVSPLMRRAAAASASAEGGASPSPA